jgi:uncharacterized protein
MSVATLRAICRCIFGSAFVGQELEVIWHAGEPLVLPVGYYETAFEVVREGSLPSCRVQHSIQTNGLLIDDAWCDLFLAHQVRLGLSIDGPAWLHDRHRISRSGKGTHERVTESVLTLQRRRVPFSVIAVLTRESLRHPDELYTYFNRLGVRSLGFNLEETEAGHVSDTLQSLGIVNAYADFMSRIFTLQQEGSMRIREFESIRSGLVHPSGVAGSTEATPLDIVSVDFQGNMATFSPELLGVELPGYGAFRFGNVATVDLAGLLADERFRRAATDIAGGVAMCRESCDYFTLCGGGAPANKFFENGSFATTETRHCATRIKANAGIVLDHLEGVTNQDPLSHRQAWCGLESQAGDPLPGVHASHSDSGRGGASDLGRERRFEALLAKG